MAANDNAAVNEEFSALAQSVIDFLNKNYHPHAVVMISTFGAELLEGVATYTPPENLVAETPAPDMPESISTVIFAIEEAKRNGCLPAAIEDAFDQYEADRIAALKA